MRLAGRVAFMEDVKLAYTILVVKSERKRLFGGLRRRWKTNIRMEFRKIRMKFVE
jgi:hypothetical protein